MKKFIQNNSQNIKHLVSQALVRRRMYLGLSQQQIAAEIGIPLRQLQQCEKG